jgi:hypothetical protein
VRNVDGEQQKSLRPTTALTTPHRLKLKCDKTVPCSRYGAFLFGPSSPWCPNTKELVDEASAGVGREPNTQLWPAVGDGLRRLSMWGRREQFHCPTELLHSSLLSLSWWCVYLSAPTPPSCKRRGCSAICPNGSLITGTSFPLFICALILTGTQVREPGTCLLRNSLLDARCLICPRFVLADTEKLHQKIGTMSDRIRQLEDALAILSVLFGHEFSSSRH